MHSIKLSALLMALPVVASAATYESQIIFSTTERQSAWERGAAPTLSDKAFAGVSWDTSKTFSGSESREVCTVSLPVLGCVARETYTGTGTVTVNTDGRVGMEFGYLVEGGSVGAELGFGVGATVPQSVTAGAATDLGTTADFSFGELSGRGPDVRLDIEQVVDIYAGATVNTSIPNQSTGRTVNERHTGTLIDIDERISLVDADLNGITWIKGITDELGTNNAGEPLVALRTDLLNQDVEWGFDFLSATPTYKIGPFPRRTLTDPTGVAPQVGLDLFAVDFQFPAMEGLSTTIGTNQLGQEALLLRQEADFMDLIVDLDGVLVPFVGLQGVNASVGPLSVYGDIMDADVFASMNVFQEFELTPSLNATLNFDNAVMIEGNLTTSWGGVWSSLPAIQFLKDTVVTPTFGLTTTLRSILGLEFDVGYNLDFFEVGAGLSIYNVDVLGGSLGPLLNFSGDSSLGEIVLRDSIFIMEGFQDLGGRSFFIDVIEDPTGPPPSAVPLPGALAAMTAGIGALGMLRRRRPPVRTMS